MYLINATTLKLESFLDDEVPDYAILSHRWSREELTFQEICNGTGTHKAGYRKLVSTCRQAIAHGLAHVWIDTCCIDKSSSAELSEAINSMFAWYRDSEVCYAYLSDVTDMTDFEHSEWFTRGFTLQELLAPKQVFFFDRDWQYLGKKYTLRETICSITSIPLLALGRGEMHEFSVAQRMSWAAGRKTTRKEDRAYSLLGIFGVNMPLLYGERDKAFVRLQEEIIKQSDDQTIFAWNIPDQEPCGMLAPNPECFADCGEIVQTYVGRYREPYNMTNKGLSIKLYSTLCAPKLYLAALDAKLSTTDPAAQSTDPESNIWIFVRPLDKFDKFARISVLGRDKIVSGSPLLTNPHVALREHLHPVPRLVLPDNALYKLRVPRSPEATALASDLQHRQMIVGQNPARPFIHEEPLYVRLRKMDPWAKTGTFSLYRDLDIKHWGVFFTERWDRDEKAFTFAMPRSWGTAFVASFDLGSDLLNADWPDKSGARLVMIEFGIYGMGRPDCRLLIDPPAEEMLLFRSERHEDVPTLLWDRNISGKSHEVISAGVSHLWIQTWNIHFFMKRQSRSDPCVIDVLHASRSHHRCAECQQLLDGLRFQCMGCENYLTCKECLYKETASHRSYERETSEKRHKFQALWPAKQNHLGTVQSMYDDNRIEKMYDEAAIPNSTTQVRF